MNYRLLCLLYVGWSVLRADHCVVSCVRVYVPVRVCVI